MVPRKRHKVTLYVQWLFCLYWPRNMFTKSDEMVESNWNVMAHGDGREGKWRGNWRMEWVASTLHTTSEYAVSSITTADAHTSAASSQLNWRPPDDLNGLVRFAERRNLVSARVPSHFKGSLTLSRFKSIFQTVSTGTGTGTGTTTSRKQNFPLHLTPFWVSWS